MIKIDKHEKALREMQALASFGKEVLALVKEAGLVRQRRRRVTKRKSRTKRTTPVARRSTFASTSGKSSARSGKAGAFEGVPETQEL